jgi:hypothetical protein
MRQLLTSLVPLCSLTRNSFHSTGILRRQSGADLWGFGPAVRRQYRQSCCRGGDCGEGTTYSDGGKDILELVDEGNKPRVIDINATEVVVSIQGAHLLPRGAAGTGRSTHAVGLAFAMAGEEVQLCCTRASGSLVYGVSVQSSWVYGRCDCW